MKAFDYQPVFKKSVLTNGVRILTEHHPYTRSTCVGFYVDLGTRDEPNNLIGGAHFLEHVLFKGTSQRSACQLVSELEAVGGEINAYTTKEYTCYHAVTLREHQGISYSVLADLISNANVDAVEVDKERRVILQELDMSKDLLEEYIFDLYLEQSYAGHPLARPILGTPESLAQVNRDILFNFYQQRYCGANLIVAVTGDVDHDRVVNELSWLGEIKRPKASCDPRLPPQLKGFNYVEERPSEQIHMIVGLPSCSYNEKFRFEAYVINAVLGGGMTSRLYQKIREHRALAYNVYSYLHSYTDSGMIMTYAGTSPENASEVLTAIRQELETIATQGVTADELR